jgi:tetratricopeptide (TPR) repeat protein
MTAPQAADLEDLFFEGADLHGEGKFDEALDRFDRCLQIDPQYADALLGKAMVHLAREEFDEAIALGERLVAIDPEDALSYTNLSLFYQRAGRIPEAEAAGAKARMLDWKRQLGEDSES